MMLRKIKKRIKKKIVPPKVVEKKIDLDKELNAHYAKVNKPSRHDRNFSRQDDIDLTEEEIKAIDEFWGKYSFAYPVIDYDSFKIFKNRCGHFDVRHCPGAVRWNILERFFSNQAYFQAHQNKGLYRLMYPNVNQPKTVLRRMAALLYDENYETMNYKEAYKLLLDELNSGHDLIIKPSGIGGGKMIEFLYAADNNTEEDIKEAIKPLGTIAMVVQHVLKQSPFMDQFNPTSLNTIRVTTLLFKGKVIPLGALIRMGAPGSKLDNYTQGGAVLGVDVKTGICNKWAMTHDLQRVTTLPSGLVLDAEDLHIPNFDKIVEAVVRMHYLTPYNRLISWDMALDENNVPTMIENNFAGSLQLHEAVGGPLFGEYMEEILDRYLIKEFNVEFKTKDWVFKEYNDHIVAKKYRGKDSTAVIPAEVKGKPVTQVDKDAFKNCKPEVVTVKDNRR